MATALRLFCSKKGQLLGQLDLNANEALDEREPAATSGNDGRFTIALTQNAREAPGASTPYLNASLVLNGRTGKCINVGTGLSLPAAWLKKAPFPAAQQNYEASSTIAVSPLTTLAAVVMSIGDLSAGPTAAFVKVAAALNLSSRAYDLASLDPARYVLPPYISTMCRRRMWQRAQGVHVYAQC